MPRNASTTSAEVGNTAPPSLVPSAGLRDAVCWAMQSAGLDDDAGAVFAEVCHAVGRGDDNCLTLRLSSKRYRMLPVQGRRALAEIDPHGGRVLIRTRGLLPRHTDPDYPNALIAFAEQYLPIADYWSAREVELKLDRARISLPGNLRDNGPRMNPLDLAELLGLQFSPDVMEPEAAALLHALDGKRPGFRINRDWIVSEVRSICRRRAYQSKPQRITVEHGGTVGLQHSGSVDFRTQSPVPTPQPPERTEARGKMRHVRTPFITARMEQVIADCLNDNSDAGVDTVIMRALEAKEMYPDRTPLRDYVRAEKVRRAD